MEEKLLPVIIVKHIDCKIHPDFTDIKWMLMKYGKWEPKLSTYAYFLTEEDTHFRRIYGQ